MKTNARSLQRSTWSCPCPLSSEGLAGSSGQLAPVLALLAQSFWLSGMIAGAEAAQ